MSTLLVRGGLLVSEQAVESGDLLLRDGRIAAIVPPGQAVAADSTLDAHGLHVLPGLVDCHVHFIEPGRTDWEGYLTGTAAAAAGGVTTVLDMPLNSHPPTLDARALALKRAAAAEHALVDYGHWGGLIPGSLDHLAELQAAGVVGVKAFLCDSGLAEYPALDSFALLDAVQRTAELGLLLGLHAEDAETTRHLGEQARAAGRRAPLDWARARPPETEIAAVRAALEAAGEAGAPLHFVHLSTGQAVRLAADARAAGQDVTTETCPHYLTLDESDLARLGPIAKCAPPLRPREVVDELWQALLDGTVDIIASDHSPCPPSMKTPDDIWQAWGGIAGVQTSLPVLLTEGVHRRGLPLSRLVALMATNPARRFGLYPRKGTLSVGSDADLALVDLDRSWTLHASELRTRWPISPFVDRTFRGMVVATLVRGRLVFEAGQIRVEPGYGKLV